MPTPKVTVAVALDGTVKVSVEGAPGATCKTLTRAVEAALGDVVEDVKTSEFNQTSATQQTLRQQGS